MRLKTHHTYIDFLPLTDISDQPGESQQANEAEQLGKSEYPESSTCQNKLIFSELSPGGQNDLFVKNLNPVRRLHNVFLKEIFFVLGWQNMQTCVEDLETGHFIIVLNKIVRLVREKLLNITMVSPRRLLKMRKM